MVEANDPNATTARVSQNPFLLGKQCVRHAARGATLGYAINIVPEVLKILIKGRNKKNLQRQILKALMKTGTLRQTAAFAAFTAIINLLDGPRLSGVCHNLFSRLKQIYGIIAIGDQELHEKRMHRIAQRALRDKRLKSPTLSTPREDAISYLNTLSIYAPRFSAAFIAGFIAIEIIPKERRKDLAVVAAVRSLDSFASHAIAHHPGILSYVPAWAHTNFDSMTFIFSSYFIMYAYFADRSLLPEWYSRWIDGMGEMPNVVRDYVGVLASGNFKLGTEQGHSKLLKPWASSHNIQLSSIDPAKISRLDLCEVIHPKISHYQNLYEIASRTFRLALPMYSMVHILLPMLFRGKLQRSLFQFLIRHIAHTLRSSAFISAFVALVWAGMCVMRHSRQAAHLAALFSGFSIFIERGADGRKGGRRAELALYVLPRALEVICGKLLRAYPSVKVARADSWIFASSIATIATFLR